MPTKTQSKKQYEATAKIMGKKYTAKGSSLMKVIEKLEPKMIAGAVILTIKHGDNEKERILPISKSRRLFLTAGLTREIAIKQTASLFEGI